MSPQPAAVEAASTFAVGGRGNGLWADPAGDYFHGDRSRAYTEAGMWGLQRVLAPPTECPQVGSGALQCLPQG